MPAYNFTLRLLIATSTLAEAVAAATIAILNQPPTGGSKIKYYVTGGTTGSGTVTTTGTVDGVPGITETIQFSANKWILGNKLFTAISGIATTGLADEATKAIVKLEAVNSGGNQLTWQVGEGPYAVSIRRKQSVNQIMKDLQEGRNSQALYYVQTDEEGLEASPSQQFTIDEIEGDTFEVWSPNEDIPAVSGDVRLKKEFYARKVTP